MTPRKNPKRRLRNLGIAIGISILMLALGIWRLDAVQPHTALQRLVFPLGRLFFFIALGLTVGQVIEAKGWTRKIGSLAAPLFRFARLGPHCSAAFSTAFLSGTAANSMLYDFWQDAKISRKQLILTNLANQLPAFFLHLPTTLLIVLPLTGWAGVGYFSLTFTAAVLRLVLLALWGRWRFDEPRISIEEGAGNAAAMDKPLAWDSMGRKLKKRFMTIVTFVLPIYTAVFLLNSAGLFDWTRQWLAHWVTDRFVPVEALSLVVLSFVAEFTSGFAAAGALLQEGVMTTKQAVLALLVGNIVAFPVRALRHQLPRLMGIFAPRLGLQILLLGQGFRVASLILLGTLFYLFW